MILSKAQKIKFGIIFLATLLLVIVLRTFFVQSYRVSSSQMETSLHKGDYLLVDKTAYGSRMPVTLLSIPFTFDSFLGLKSYCDNIQLPYKRFGKIEMKKNDIVLFNNPIQRDKPLDKRTLLLSRCLAVPGDTLIGSSDDELFINGKKHIYSPDLLNLYSYNISSEKHILLTMELFNIPLREAESTDSEYKNILLSNSEIFILEQQLPSSYLLESNAEKITVSYRFIVPAKNMEIELTDYNIQLYKDIIMDENPNQFEWKEGRLLHGNTPINKYLFKDDYFWFISDNPYESIDSRQVGFVSEKYIIGKASHRVLSSSDGRINLNKSLSSIK